MTNTVAWQYTNTVKQEKIAQFELFAEMLDATFNTSAFDGMEQTETDFLDETTEDVEISIFFENDEFFNKQAVEEELEKIAGVKVELTSIGEHDWQEESVQSFPPIEIGRFYIHSFDEQAEADKVCLKIPARMAFGTGEHATTKGCLALYDELTKENNFKNGLDMGCGSAILAMAAYKADETKFLGVDIDELSVEIANENMLENSITDGMKIIHGDGFNDKLVSQTGPYDIIFANILKNPLLAMSADLVATMQEGGYAILSGFKEEGQKAEILAKYVDELGLTAVSEFNEGGWSAVCFKK